MATNNFTQIKPKGINLPSNTSQVVATAGDIAYNSTTNKFQTYASAADYIVQEATTATLTNKTLDATANTISNLANTNLNGSAGITNTNLASMAANTVKANTTASPATPSDVALGTVTEASSAVLTLTGWADATIGSPTIQVKQASGTQSGYLSSTDWTTFNSKQASGNYITTLTGDVAASGPGSAASTIQANVVSNSKLAQMAANSIKGNNTALAANASDLTVAQAQTLLVIPTATAPLPIGSGGTGQTTQQAALNALSGTQSAGKYLRSDGTNTTLSAIQAADVPTLNQNTTGTASNVTSIVAPANGGTGVANSSNLTWTSGNALTFTTSAATNVTLPTTGTLATLAGTETLSNKTFSTAITLDEIAKPSNPPLNTLRLYAKSDDKLYTLNGSGTETQVGSGGSGGSKNYLAQYVASYGSPTANTGNGDFEAGATTGWSLAHSALSSAIPTSVATAGNVFSSTSGGSAASANLSLAVTTVGQQIGGNYSGSLASSAASVAGDMLISDAFYIDAEDQAKVMQIKFYYTANSGASNLNFSGTSSNSFAVWIYDVTNGAWIMPAGVYNLVQNSGVGYCTATFQTTSNSTRYQLALVNINASAGAYTLFIDDFSVGPQTAPMGPAMSDWQSFTPTGSFTSNITYTGFWRRIGDSAEIYYQVNFSGSPNAATFSVNLPSGLVIDYTKTPSDGAEGTLGTGYIARNGVFGSMVQVWPDGTTAFALQALQSQNASNPTNVGPVASVTNTSPFTWASGDIFSFGAKVPIAGWSSNTVMSSDTDTRVVASSISTSQAFTASSSGTYPSSSFTVSFDTHGTMNSSTGIYTAPVTGYYDLDGFSNVSLASAYMLLIYRINGSATTFFGTGITTGDRLSGSTLLKLNAGDTVQVGLYSNNSAGTNVYLQWSISRRSGPAVVAATESVNASYFSTNGPSIGTTEAVVIFNSKNYDSHGEYNTSTGLYTIPVSGKYSVKAYLTVSSATLTTGEYLYIDIYKNGSFFMRIANVNGSGSLLNYNAGGSADLQCNAGDTIAIYGYCSVGTTLLTTSGYNSFSIARVGN